MNGNKRAKNFEDLEVWQEGCDLAVDIYRVAAEGQLSKNYGLRDQMTKAAVSIPSNVAEGKERETVPELIRHLYIAKGSGGELRTQLYIAHKIGHLDEVTFHDLSKRSRLLSKKLGGFIKMLRQNKSSARSSN